jgi:hypothetical protein
MNTKTLFLGAITAIVVGGAAYAAGQDTNHTSAIDDPQKMGAFYTDSGMKTMKGDADFKTAWMALTQDDRDSMMKSCADSKIATDHDTFCSKAKELGGAN